MKQTLESNVKFIFVINGSGGCGKDTIIEEIRVYLDKMRYKCMNESSIDPVKQLLQSITDGRKGLKERKLLSDVKTAVTEYNDLPTEYLKDKLHSFLISDNTMKMLFVHIREPEEIEKFINIAKKEVHDYILTYRINNNTAAVPIAVINEPEDEYKKRLQKFKDSPADGEPTFVIKTLYVSRPSITEPYGNSSDDNVRDFKYDHYFDNVYTLEPLRSAVELWIDAIFKMYS